MTSDKIPEPMKRIAFGAKPLPPEPDQIHQSARQLQGNVSRGSSESGIKPMIVVEGLEKTEAKEGPASTQVTPQKATKEIDTTPLAKRFKKQ
jgi:hypothetical protein